MAPSAWTTASSPAFLPPPLPTRPQLLLLRMLWLRRERGVDRGNEHPPLRGALDDAPVVEVVEGLAEALVVAAQAPAKFDPREGSADGLKLAHEPVGERSRKAPLGLRRIVVLVGSDLEASLRPIGP